LVLAKRTLLTVHMDIAGSEVKRTKALDPLASPDAKTAHATMLAAEFAAARLRTLLLRLQQRLRRRGSVSRASADAASDTIPDVD
jgi:hypothetical protein